MTKRSSHTPGPLRLGFPFPSGQDTATHFHVIFFVASRKTGKPKVIIFQKFCVFSAMGTGGHYLVHLGWFFRVTTFLRCLWIIFWFNVPDNFTLPGEFQLHLSTFPVHYLRLSCLDWHENTLSREILKQKQVFFSKSYPLYFESDKRLGNVFLFSGQVKGRSSTHQIKCIQFTSTMCSEL